MQLDQDRSIVIENGTSVCRAGFSGEDDPKVVPSVVGYPKNGAMMGNQQTPYYVGNDAIQKRGILHMKYPVQKGLITDFQHLQKLLYHCFCHQLKVDVCSYKVLLSQTIFDAKADRQKRTQLIFQTFNVPGFYLANRCLLALYGTGRASGLAIHSGDQITQYAAIQNGKVVDNAVLTTHIAGSDITRYLGNMFQTELGLIFSSSAQIQILKQIKQKLCYVAQDVEKQQECFSKKAAPSDLSGRCSQYVLPDENVISVKDQAFRAPQAMFDPKLLGQDAFGVHQNVRNLIEKIKQPTLKTQMYKNIVLSGGNFRLKGIRERLTEQVLSMTQKTQTIKVLCPPQVQNLSWIGGSILTSLCTFESQWITKAQYDQYGPQIVTKRCG